MHGATIKSWLLFRLPKIQGWRVTFPVKHHPYPYPDQPEVT